MYLLINLMHLLWISSKSNVTSNHFGGLNSNGLCCWLFSIPPLQHSQPYSTWPAPVSSILPGSLASCWVWLMGVPAKDGRVRGVWWGAVFPTVPLLHCSVSKQFCPFTALASVEWLFLHNYNPHWTALFALFVPLAWGWQCLLFAAGLGYRSTPCLFL